MTHYTELLQAYHGIGSIIAASTMSSCTLYKYLVLNHPVGLASLDFIFSIRNKVINDYRPRTYSEMDFVENTILIILVEIDSNIVDELV